MFHTIFPFLITLLEWYEFSIYNSIMFYMADIIHSSTNSIGLYIFGISYLFRPVGSLAFSYIIKDKMRSLNISLLMMCFSTLMLALTPMKYAVLWISVAKIIQALAIGGSYGINYAVVYDSEMNMPINERRCNYRIAWVQTAWVWGIILGACTVTLCKIIIGNQDFIIQILYNSDLSFSNKLAQILYLQCSDKFLKFGWRIPFGISALCGILLFILIKIYPITPQKSPIINHDKFSFMKSFIVFMIISLEMIIFYTYYSYIPGANEKHINEGLFSVIMLLHKFLLIPMFILSGLLLDKMSRYFKSINQIALFIVCLMAILSSRLINIQFDGGFTYSCGMFLLITSIITSLCYAALIPFVVSVMPSRQIGFMFNLAAAMFAGFIPYIFKEFMIPKELLMMSLLCIPTIGLIIFNILTLGKDKK